jgi:hypothetical protein
MPLATLPTECVPESLYDWCWEGTECYGDACANARIQFSQITDINGRKYGDPNEDSSTKMVKEAAIYVDCIGDRLYVYRGLTSIDSVECTEEGCNGQELDENENVKYVIGVTGDSNPDNSYFVCWDKTVAGNGDWAWQAVGVGWASEPGYIWMTVVECVEASDCDINYECPYFQCVAVSTTTIDNECPWECCI